MWRNGRERILIKVKRKNEGPWEREIENFDKGEIICNGLGQVAIERRKRKRVMAKEREL
jgi:hypothetical protein